MIYNARYIHFFINSKNERMWNMYDSIKTAKQEMEALGGCIVETKYFKAKS
jgi:hypothetical protein